MSLARPVRFGLGFRSWIGRCAKCRTDRKIRAGWPRGFRLTDSGRASQPAQLNFACAVFPSGPVSWTTPFGCAGNATLAVPESSALPAGSSRIRWDLPSTTRMATALNPVAGIDFSILVADEKFELVGFRNQLDVVRAGIRDPPAIRSLVVVRPGASGPGQQGRNKQKFRIHRHSPGVDVKKLRRLNLPGPSPHSRRHLAAAAPEELCHSEGTEPASAACRAGWR